MQKRSALGRGLSALLPSAGGDPSQRNYMHCPVEHIRPADDQPRKRIDEAESLRRLLDDHGRTQEELAERLGRDRSSIANTLRLLKLPREVQLMLVDGSISAGHARALLALDHAGLQVERAEQIVQDGL